ncbi:MAG TPA: triphosphoribosyl-dephospho-CoA synthase [Candidatus Deferrimicrobium sp.]|nr:triphosphoribosyl-dephospho-CoA synthase [Candidatus Deferrimicrobium sp.]
MNWANTEKDIAMCGSIAALLEVSGYPKPGNVHRTCDFKETRYEHFLISSVILSPILETIAHRGYLAKKNQITLNEIKLGECILKGAKLNQLWHTGGNTNFGILLLLIPLACAAGMLIDHPSPSIQLLRENLEIIIKNSTSEDTIELYEAIRLIQPGGLGAVERFDVASTSSDKLQQENINLFKIFKLSADWDSIAREWVTNFQITFEIGYPYFKSLFSETNDINISIVHTYLKILGDTPDTLISRKYGKALAELTSHKAKYILNEGGLLSKESIELLWKFDLELRNEKKINPGTTADLTAASIMVALLEGMYI